MYTPEDPPINDSDTAPILAEESLIATDSREVEPSESPISPLPPQVPFYKLLIEPPVFMVFFAITFTATVLTNQIQYQACTVAFKFDPDDCEPLLGVIKPTNKTENIQNVVQPYVSDILMVRSSIESVLPAILSIVIGPWSDKFGRRPLLFISVTGYFLSYVILTVLTGVSTYQSLNPWLFVLTSIPIGLSGGSCILVAGIYSYVSDVAANEQRPKRMIIMNGVQAGSLSLGNVVGGYVYAATNMITIFSISTGILLVASVYFVFIIEESLKSNDTQTSLWFKIRSLFRFGLVKDFVRACIQDRPDYGRPIIWLTMLSLVISNFAVVGEANLFYLFVQKKFNWTVKDFSTFNGISSIVQISGCICAIVLLLRVVKISTVTVGLISLACCFMESLVRALAVYSWQLYLGLGLGIIRGVVIPMLLATLSLVAIQSEVGKIFALTTSMLYLSALGATPLYNLVYNATLVNHSGAYNFISVGLYLLCFIFMAIIFGLRWSLRR